MAALAAAPVMAAQPTRVAHPARPARLPTRSVFAAQMKSRRSAVRAVRVYAADANVKAGECLSLSGVPLGRSKATDGH